MKRLGIFQLLAATAVLLLVVGYWAGPIGDTGGDDGASIVEHLGIPQGPFDPVLTAGVSPLAMAPPSNRVVSDPTGEDVSIVQSEVAIAIQGDKDIPFRLLKKVMYTCGQAEFGVDGHLAAEDVLLVLDDGGGIDGLAECLP